MTIPVCKLNVKVVLIIFLFVSSSAMAGNSGCFAIVAGKKATADGCVLFGHNEDDGCDYMLNLYSVNAVPGTSGVGGAAGFKWVEIPGLEIADAFMNGYGVCVASDGCPSREDREDYTDGGVLYVLRLRVAQQAKTAREAVSIIGSIVRQYGYRASGRSYIVADREEAWVVAVVQGRHWVAQRVPDDKVAVIPNCYTISDVDLSDTLNFMGSGDIKDYALRRGWYKPSREEFSFRRSYSSEDSAGAQNTERHSRVLSYLTGGSYDYDSETVGFAVTPSHKLTVRDMIKMLSIHSESGTSRHGGCVCSDDTVVSTIFQMRSGMPLDVGCLMWVCPGHPCAEAYLPMYLGVTSLPAGFSRFTSAEEALQKHLSEKEGLRERWPDALCWRYGDRWKALSEDYGELIAERSAEVRKVQDRFLRRQKTFEKMLLRLSSVNASEQMNDYFEKCCNEAL